MTQENDIYEGEDPQKIAKASPPDEGALTPAENAIAEAVFAAEDFFPHEADVGSAKGKNLDLICAFFLRNDIGNAKRLRARFGQDLMYVRDHGWYGWTGTHWSLDEGKMIAERCAHATADAIFHEVKALEDLAAKTTDEEKKKTLQASIRAHRGYAVKTGNSQKLASMLNVAEPYLTHNVSELDAQVNLFNVKNGTIDLFNVEAGIRPHKREDMITRVANASWKDNAPAPTEFERFMATILPDEDVRMFIQKYFGYCLTGLTTEQCLVLFQGGGSNGKSTLMDLMKYIFGDYSKIIPIDSLLYQDRNNGAAASPDIARLPGTRLVMASEPEVGARLSESRVKSFTGSEEISTRHLNKGFFDFKPQFKLCLAFNNKPTIRGQDDGIWRRLLLVPFKVMIPLEQRDHLLPDKLRAEADLIMSWLVNGCWFWRKEKLSAPDAIVTATAEYRAENDPVGQFLESGTKKMMNCSVRASKLFEAYEMWCDENGASPITQTAFGKRMLEKGYEKLKSSTIQWKGLFILDEYDPDKSKEQTHAVL
jgi:putative DNA primase/helicase